MICTFVCACAPLVCTLNLTTGWLNLEAETVSDISMGQGWRDFGGPSWGPRQHLPRLQQPGKGNPQYMESAGLSRSHTIPNRGICFLQPWNSLWALRTNRKRLNPPDQMRQKYLCQQGSQSGQERFKLWMDWGVMTTHTGRKQTSPLSAKRARIRI